MKYFSLAVIGLIGIAAVSRLFNSGRAVRPGMR